MAFGFVLRDLLSAANYCALAPASPEREELLRWLQGASRRVRRMAERSGHKALIAPLTRLARAADASLIDPSQAERLICLVQAVFAAHDPPGLQPFIALSSSRLRPDSEDTDVLGKRGASPGRRRPSSVQSPRRPRPAPQG